MTPTTAQLATATLEELRKNSPQRRERLFEVLCERYPRRISKADVKHALQLLERQKKAVQLPHDVWAVAGNKAYAVPLKPVPLPIAAEGTARFGRQFARSAVAAPQSATPTAPAPPDPGASVDGTPIGLLWSIEQKAVIEAPKDDWLLVEAGPGTGKTAVACARVAHLLDQGIPGHAIVMVSFTRTAVTELRERIRELARESRGAASVRITTLDSEAWHLGVGFGSTTAKDRLQAGYSANIRDAAKLLKKRDAALLDWLEGTQHLIIDEGQDLVGARSELVLCLLDVLVSEAGVTVFVDPAQAIYGFSNDSDDDETTAGTETPFHEQLLDNFEFRSLRLTKLFRTSAQALSAVFDSGRSIALGSQPPGNRLNALHALVENNCEVGRSPDAQFPSEDELVLYRRRSEVLLASSYLSSKQVPHRLRLSQVELGIQPWVGALIPRLPPLRVSQAEFEAAWRQLEMLPLLKSHSVADAWALLVRTARASGSDAVDLRALRRVLSTGRPPPEFCLTEAGLSGPTLGTIHASKGRESTRVRLMLSQRRGNSDELAEEVRVDYVGATRARELMTVGRGYAAYGFRGLRGPGDRIQRVQNTSDHPAIVELGRPGDVDELSPVSKTFQTSTVAAEKLQTKLLNYDSLSRELLALQLDARPWPYILSAADDKTTWGALSQRVNHDLLALRKEFPAGERLVPPNQIRHIHLIGVRTVVLSEGDARLASLHEPWATTGVFLAPVVKALTKVFFRWRNNRRGAA